MEIGQQAVHQGCGVKADYKGAQDPLQSDEDQERLQVEHACIEHGVHSRSHQGGGEHHTDKDAVGQQNPKQGIFDEPPQPKGRIDSQSQPGGDA